MVDFGYMIHRIKNLNKDILSKDHQIDLNLA